MLVAVSLNEMAAKADIIVQGTVLATKNIGKNKYGFETVGNLIQVDKPVLKGNVKVGDKIKIKTFADVEDSATFEKGQKFLLFLKKEDNHYLVFNGLQGEWIIMNNGKFGGLGHDKTIKDVKKALKEGFNAKLKKPVFKM